MDSPCAYASHRRHDWTVPGTRRLTCGICHPPPPKLIACDAAVYLNPRQGKTWMHCPWCGSSGAVNAHGVGVSRRSLDAMPCEHCGGWGCVPIEDGVGTDINRRKDQEQFAAFTRRKHDSTDLRMVV